MEYFLAAKRQMYTIMPLSTLSIIHTLPLSAKVKNGQAPIRFTDTSGKAAPAYTIAENKKYPVYYDPFDTAEATATYNTWKPGLQTYYPREINITY